MAEVPNGLRARRMVATAYTALPPDAAMHAMMALPLPAMFDHWGPFPAVKDVTYLTGGWDEEGKQRTVNLINGGGMLETIARLEPGKRFTYRLTQFNHSFQPIASAIDDDWVFEADGTGTRITWTWTFHATPAQRLLGVLLHPVWQHYMRRILPVGAAKLTVS